MKIYLDTNVYLDYWEDRKDKFKPLGEFAFSLMKETINCRFFVLISEIVIKELRNVLFMQKEKIFATILSSLKESGKLVFVDISMEQVHESEKISRQKNIPKADALHAVLARDNKAVLVSRDKHHILVKDIVEVMKPEEILTT
ncbi:MAG: PIN domain-containing protein [Candidatus Nanoarchaeia archaeon]|nr:PIN domain-containing protein [Candidatus Nanoarchaeia archaeon]